MAAPAGVKSVAKWMASAVRGPPDLVAALPGYASAAETMWLDEDDMDLISVGTLQQQLCAGNGLHATKICAAWARHRRTAAPADTRSCM